MSCLCIRGGRMVGVAAAAAWPCPWAASFPSSISATPPNKTPSKTSSTTMKMLTIWPWIGACHHPSGNRSYKIRLNAYSTNVYMARHLVRQHGWVDFDFGCSTRSGCATGQYGGTSHPIVNPTQLPDQMPHTVKKFLRTN